MNRIEYIKDLNSWEEEFHFYHPVKVRFSEIDMFGHLNNTIPFSYFEQARIEYFKSLGFMQNWIKPSFETIPVVANLQCDYLKQVFLDENLKIYVKTMSIGNSSIDIHYVGKQENGDTCFVGRGTIVQISKKSGKGVPWTEEMKKKFKNESSIKS